VSTLVPSTALTVRWPAAASHGTAAGAWPPWWRHGWKWSDTAISSRPIASAWREYSSSVTGSNCSADAL
jgi:hypothetical protein